MTMFDFMISATTNIFRIYLIYWFVSIFLGRTVQSKKKIFLVCACFYITNIMLFWIFHTMWINMVCNLIGIGAIVRLFTKSLKTNLFVTGTIYLINMGCDVAGTFLFIQYEDGQNFSQIYEMITVFLILICLIFTGKIITLHKDAERAQNISLLIVPLCSIVIILVLTYLHICEEIGIVVVALGLLIINFFMLYLYNHLLRSISQKYETKMLKDQVQIYANQLDVILHSEEKVKSLRHDMKYHMNELKLLANKYDAVEIQEYIDRMECFIHNPKEIVASGNMEIDSILNYMLQKAKTELETVKVKVMLPEEIKHSFDLNVLIGNLLENAIEAARQSEAKYLSVYIALQKGVLRIQVDNSFAGEIVSVKEGKDGSRIFLTTKKKKEQHGIGLKNVKKIVESYNGNMDIQTEGGIFSVKVILYMSRIENAI